MDGNTDITITCRECGKQFLYTIDEQTYYRQKGFSQPQHCRECRSNRRNQYVPLCSSCGSELHKGSVVYCPVCLATARLDLELDLKRLEQSLSEAAEKVNCLETEKVQLNDAYDKRVNTIEQEKAAVVAEAGSRVREAECEAARIAQLLQQEKQARAELEASCRTLREDLDKAVRYRANLDGIEPALTQMRRHLETIEQGQGNLQETVSELNERTRGKHEHTGVIAALARLFRPNIKSYPLRSNGR